MPRQESPRLSISYGWLRGEDYWGDPMSTNMLLADALTHPFATSMTQPGPPAGDIPPGAQFIVPKLPEGPWASHPDALATYHGPDKGWFMVNAFRGLRVDVEGVGFVYYNGSDWQLESETHGEDPEFGTRYDIAVSVGYAPVGGETLLFLPLATSLFFPADANGSVATARTPPSEMVALSIRRNGTEVGSVTFSPSSFSGTFVFPNAVVFAPADRIEVVCPARVPDSFGVFGFTLRATVMQ